MNHSEPAYKASPLDEARSLLKTQAIIVRDALDRSERAERELAKTRTALHFAERAVDAAREAARNAAPSGAAAVSAALRGLPDSSGMAREPEEPLVKALGAALLE
jgi:hypothetical protein